MTDSGTGPGKAKLKREETEHIQSQAAMKPSVPRAQTGPEDVASQEATREALRNAGRGDQFVVASDLEDSDQREAAPGTREQD